LRPRASIWIGLIVAVLVPLALFLFGVLNGWDSLAAVFLLGGLWIFVFGLAFTGARDRLFFSGWGLVIAALSSFAVLRLQYALGLEVIVILAVIVASVFMRPASRPRAPPGQAPSTTT